ncbi:hypothetical protein LVB87_12240 [Lysobacter sp. KIS68-7]|uniref:hypothetical protein n=1 Tax=Lysobacter sp. KIS68-7 TaxID=2904252 RepID=UPI001E293535|nr:hypothetical protein [Lysobacter sp. KIS68-7]UHQ18948.1 hypothetical protein LVB87_12240 [Lysobacter sp. KIS68-7]
MNEPIESGDPIEVASRALEDLKPFARTINALIRFRIRQWDGLEDLNAQHKDADVRVLDAWVREVARQDGKRGPKVPRALTEPIPGRGDSK